MENNVRYKTTFAMGDVEVAVFTQRQMIRHQCGDCEDGSYELWSESGHPWRSDYGVTLRNPHKVIVTTEVIRQSGDEVTITFLAGDN